MISPHPDQQPQLTVGIGLDVGQARQHKPNQDSVGTYSDYCDDAKWLASKGRLFVVADGMGGAAGGKEASAMAVETVIDSYYEDPELEIRPSLERAIQEANRQIKDYGQAEQSVRGLGTTVVAAVIRGRELVVANVGDSRAYLLRQGTLRQLSLDHTSVQEQVRLGLLTPEEALTHPRHHVLSRNLGSRPQAQPDFATETLLDGDTLLLCSDGLWNPVSDEEIAELLQRMRGKAAARALIGLANEYGGPDNICVIIVHIGESVTAPDHRTEQLPALLPAMTEAPDHRTEQLPALLPAMTEAADPTLIAPAAAQHRAPRQPSRLTWRWVGIAAGVVLALIAMLALGNTFISTGEQVVANSTSVSAAQTAAPQDTPVVAAPTAALQHTQLAVAATLAPQPTALPSLAPTTHQPATPGAPAAEGDFLHRLEHQEDVRGVAFTPDGQTLVSLSLDSTVKLWRVRDGTQLLSEKVADTPVTSVALAPNGQTLAVGSPDGMIKLWQVGITAGTTITLTPTRMMNGHSSALTNLVFTADGQMLASTAGDEPVMTWNVRDGSIAQRLAQTGEAITTIAFAPDGKTLATGFSDGTVKLWGLDDEPVSEFELQGGQKPVTSVAFSPDGKLLAVGSQDAPVALWFVSDAKASLLRSLEGQSGGVQCVVFAPGGQVLASTSPDGAVRLWLVSKGVLIRTFAQADRPTSVVFAPDGAMLATSSARGTVTLWQVPDELR